ncbi:MAG: M20/M25/M40 family metallo-hydrolase [Candidatus Andersenbacteria bacterium]
MNVDLELLKRLIAIRSDREAQPRRGSVERGVADYLETYIERHLPTYRVRRQVVTPGRVNLVVTPRKRVQAGVLLIGHMDTVPLGTGWRYRSLGQRVGSRLYGRGSADMKAGLVAILVVLEHAAVHGCSNVAALFYADEEYDFVGMKQFVRTAGLPRPRLVICPEPTNLALRAGCRGVLELDVAVRGKSGHAARPWSGVSAFEGLLAGVDALKRLVRMTNDRVLGKPTLNVTGVRCGIGDGSTAPANVIPDTCSATIEVRTVTGLTPQRIIRTFERAVRAYGANPATTTKNSLGSFTTPRSKLRLVEQAQRSVLGRVSYAPAGKGGYSDIQLLAERWRVPAVLLGPTGAGMHGLDEFVTLQSIADLSAILCEVVDNATARL